MHHLPTAKSAALQEEVDNILDGVSSAGDEASEQLDGAAGPSKSRAEEEGVGNDLEVSVPESLLFDDLREVFRTFACNTNGNCVCKKGNLESEVTSSAGPKSVSVRVEQQSDQIPKKE
jgi:hypothetical protein